MVKNRKNIGKRISAFLLIFVFSLTAMLVGKADEAYAYVDPEYSVWNKESIGYWTEYGRVINTSSTSLNADPNVYKMNLEVTYNHEAGKIFLDLLNKDRASGKYSNGVPLDPVELDDLLTYCAEGQTPDALAYLSHGGAAGDWVSGCFRAINLSSGTGISSETIKSQYNALKNSSGHWQYMISPKLKYIGVGVACTSKLKSNATGVSKYSQFPSALVMTMSYYDDNFITKTTEDPHPVFGTFSHKNSLSYSGTETMTKTVRMRNCGTNIYISNAKDYLNGLRPNCEKQTCSARVMEVGDKLNFYPVKNNPCSTWKVAIPYEASSCTWSSSNTNVLTIDSNGVATGKKVGKATVTCKVKNIFSGTAPTASVVIQVSPKGTIPTPPEPGVTEWEIDGKEYFADPNHYWVDGEYPKSGGSGSSTGGSSSKVKVRTITINGISHKIAAGKKIKLTAKVSPSNAANKAVTWKSSNTKVATVTSTGTVTVKAKTGGKSVTITATAKDGSKVKGSWKITSMKGVVKKIALSGKTSVKKGSKITLKAKITASKGANRTLKWTSSNKKYATVSSKGVVKGLKKGKTVTITAKATDGSGKYAKKKITIK